MAIALAIGASLCSCAFCQGNELIIEKVTSSSLNGVVHYDELPDKHHALEGVSVATCDASFKSCSEVVMTDSSGHFSITEKGKQKIYYLRFLLLGWDQEHVTVSLKRGSAPLHIRLHVGT